MSGNQWLCVCVCACVSFTPAHLDYLWDHLLKLDDSRVLQANETKKSKTKDKSWKWLQGFSSLSCSHSLLRDWRLSLQKRKKKKESFGHFAFTPFQIQKFNPSAERERQRKPWSCLTHKHLSSVKTHKRDQEERKDILERQRQLQNRKEAQSRKKKKRQGS